MLECLICNPSPWMRLKIQRQTKMLECLTWIPFLNEAQGIKTNPDLGVFGFHSTLLDENQNIEANPDVNLPDAQYVSH